MVSRLAARLAAAALIATSIASCGSSGTTLPKPNASSGTFAAKTTPLHHENIDMLGVHNPQMAAYVADKISTESSRRRGEARIHVSSVRQAGVSAESVKTVIPATLGTASTLVVYDTTGQWGFLGELYAMEVANLAGHFGAVSTEPIVSYTTGQINQYTATIYVGSTYDEPIPAAFYTDVAASTHPVVWANDNIWDFADSIGPAAFETKYGWDPTNSYFSPNGSVGAVTQVSYKSVALTRTVPQADDGGVLHPYIMGGTYPAVTTLASAVDTSTSPSTTFPWAIQSGNLTYVGESPFDFVTETDRLLAFEDLLFNVLAPSTATRHRALVRLEDINPGYDSTDIKNLTALATWLYNNHISYGFGVIPVYMDPKGCYNGGTAQTVTLSQNTALVTELKYMQTHGGTLVDHGYTHQDSAVDNPYDEVTADDAEFFIAQLSPTNDQSCGVNVTDTVEWTGPVTGDSQAWAQGRLNSALSTFSAAGLTKPTVFEFPHYAASAPDYAAVKATYSERYERSMYFNGLLSGGTVSGTSFVGQFFPYVVQDVYGQKVLPENLSNYEPLASNGNPAHPPAMIINNAKANLVVRDGFASFFFHPYYYAAGQPDGTSGVTDFQTIINGIKSAGYTFVAPTTL